MWCLFYADEKGNVWAFNYFFYNKGLKRMLYFSCRGKSKSAADSRNTSKQTSSGLVFHEKEGDNDDEAITKYGMANSMEL